VTKPASNGRDPSPAELAAIVAAIELAWPRPVIAGSAPAPVGPDPWRFSGRWWARPETVRRQRPWLTAPS
jgi:hypothetical protein